MDGGDRIDREGLRLSLQKASRRGPAQRRLHQAYCVYLVSLGHSCRDVASWFGDSERSVERWVSGYPIGPPTALAPRGRPARLNAAQRSQLYQDLAQSPHLLGHAAARWDGQTLRLHLLRRYAVSLSERQCQRALRRYREDSSA